MYVYIQRSVANRKRKGTNGIRRFVIAFGHKYQIRSGCEWIAGDVHDVGMCLTIVQNDVDNVNARARINICPCWIFDESRCRKYM